MPESKACNFIKIETLAQVFSFEFYEISKNTFFKEHLSTTASIKTKSTDLMKIWFENWNIPSAEFYKERPICKFLIYILLSKPHH